MDPWNVKILRIIKIDCSFYEQQRWKALYEYKSLAELLKACLPSNSLANQLFDFNSPSQDEYFIPVFSTCAVDIAFLQKRSHPKKLSCFQRGKLFFAHLHACEHYGTMHEELAKNKFIMQWCNSSGHILKSQDTDSSYELHHGTNLQHETRLEFVMYPVSCYDCLKVSFVFSFLIDLSRHIGEARKKILKTLQLLSLYWRKYTIPSILWRWCNIVCNFWTY